MPKPLRKETGLLLTGAIECPAISAANCCTVAVLDIVVIKVVYRLSGEVLRAKVVNYDGSVICSFHGWPMILLRQWRLCAKLGSSVWQRSR
jgi:hypothetical protein